ncbi:3-methyl-2-oxobutanoate hydroxymethyltransferase [Wenzhouxiangella sp. XN79A]|uniref:3-methyl-2-oxobutanoate hydroxymethyltransferase n=1 Tax=Wenzhouxiangella sp. XN79A TaxID=2724193 RepID=UPI00144A9419|nr:3-methyl-2-oxobutanoate hydroxymethyltransferase [Wenzhouxiangella sp. XN79A]NKI35457.1 3-methyl-2-oxobutanoate hydroxymethyltransferase [Wenzhouxiangella sp. XN79A]
MNGDPPAAATGPVTRERLAAKKRAGQPITMLTAYDATLARTVDAAGVDCILVGDSLGNVIQGRASTVPVTLDDMAYHTACVRRGVERALVIADLPFLSYTDVASAVASARRVMQAGAAMVKLEGGAPVFDAVERLTALGVPVCGHLGLTPQAVHQLSGYKVQARDRDARRRLLDEARGLEQRGAAMLVLECVPSSLAAEVAEALAIPVIGIGAGVDVDGQVLVLHDALGLGGERRPRFVRDFMADAGSIPAAIEAFVAAVRDGSFPDAREAYGD